MPPEPIRRRIFISHAWGADGDSQSQVDHETILAFLRAGGIDPHAKLGTWARARPVLLKDGREVHLEVFYDEASIPLLADLTETLRSSIAASHLFVACWSARYPTRAACAFELGASWLARPGGIPPWVVALPVNLASGAASLPSPLRSRLLVDLGRAPAKEVWEALAIHAAARPETPIGALPPVEAPRTYGFSLPSLAHFVGRTEELWRVWDALHAAGNQGTALVTGAPAPAALVPRVAMKGLGGVGKSMLAQVYSTCFGGAYPGGIFWMGGQGHDAQGRGMDHQTRDAARRAQLRTFADTLGLIAEGEKLDDDQILSRLKQRLTAKGPYLWIVDDLPSSMPEGTLARWMAPTGEGHTLLTSRGRLLENERATIHLGVLPLAEAVLLLTRPRTPATDQEREAASAIAAAELGGLPLALSVAAALIADDPGDTPYARFLELLRRAGPVRHLEDDKDLVGELPTGHERSILFTFARSFEALPDEASRDALRVASVGAPYPLPVPMVEGTLEGLGAPRPDRALRALVRACLADPSTREEDKPPTITVHNLVAQAMELWSTPQRLVEVREVLVERVAQEMPRAGDIREHAALTAWLPHARHLVDESVAGLHLLGWLGRYAFERGDYQTARMDLEEQWRAQSALLDPEHPDTLTSRNNLAEILRAQGEFTTARRLQEAVLETRVRLLGPEHPSTLTSRSTLALTLKAQGDLAGARGHEEAVLDARSRLLGPKHLDTLASRNNLAQTLFAQGDLVGARGHQGTVLDAMIRLLGEEHPATLTSRHNMAQILFAQGDLAGARCHQEAVLDASVRLLGPQHHDTLVRRNNLASTLFAQGDLTGAQGHQEAVLDGMGRMFGEEHPHTLASRSNLAKTLLKKGDLVGARGHQETALDARVRLLGAEHPSTLTSRNDLAQTLSAQGDFAGARALGEVVLDARVRLLGTEHPDTLASRSNLAVTLFSQGDLAGARGHLEAILPAMIRLLGEEHPSTLTSRNNLAQTLQAQGDLARARGHHEAILEARVRLFGSAHPDTLASRNNLAHTLQAQGDLAGARSHQEAVLDAMVSRLGPEHPDTLTSRNHLASTLFAQGDLAGARGHEEAVLHARGRLLGPEHPATLTSRLNLAQTLYAQGDLAGARGHQEAVLDARVRRLGPRHSDTTGSAWTLFMTLVQLQAPEASRVFEEWLIWLIGVEPATLSHQQQQIQTMAVRLISHDR